MADEGLFRWSIREAKRGGGKGRRRGVTISYILGSPPSPKSHKSLLNVTLPPLKLVLITSFVLFLEKKRVRGP